ncbi:MAG: hypothetical protein KBC64_06630 [Simkaniaceae bacterium]|nr:hypothetical protein [Simkaniaceae bacterium]
MTPQQKRNTVVSRVFAFTAVAAFAVVFAVGHFHSMSVAAHVGMGVGAAGAVAASAAVAHFFAQHRYKDKDSHKGSVQSS